MNSGRLQYELHAHDLRRWLALPRVQAPGRTRRLRLIRFGGAVATLVVCALLTRAMASPLFLLYGLAGGTAFVLLTLPLVSGGHDLLASDAATLGVHEVALADDGIVHRIAGGKSSTLRWRDLRQVDAVGDLTMISGVGCPPLVIPRDCVTDGLYDTFVADLRQRWHAHLRART